jgi:large subunit ribosomal protein L25
MDKPITASVPLVFIGESPAVKNSDGVLVKVLHEVEVKALPGDLPHEISADIGVLASFEEQITAGDLRLPNGVTLLTHAAEIVALVRQQEAEETPEETRTIEDIEVVAKGKKEEEKDEDAVSPAP